MPTLQNQFTKEAIKNRLMENAANLWEVKNVNALDPFVRLLMEAFSMEVYRAANETQQIESRILDKIAQLLTPTLLTMPQPAHGILRALPVDPLHILTPFTPFYIKKVLNRLNNKDRTTTINFTSIDNTYLVQAKISYLATGYQLFNFAEDGSKAICLRTDDPLPWSTCYIGVELGHELENLQHASLYFDFPSHTDQNWIYQLLPLCAITLDDQPVSFKPGKEYLPSSEMAMDESIFLEHNMMQKITNQVKKLYHHKFLTIGDQIIDKDQETSSWPEAILSNFNKNSLQKFMNKKMVWLTIKFPEAFNYEILSDMHISFNAFPVVNCSLITRLHDVKQLDSIIPLRSEKDDHFMAIHAVSDNSGKIYTEIPFGQASNKGGSYALRYGGAERFDNRSAQDLVNFLIELCRDEVVAFSSLNQDFMRAVLQTISKELSIMQHRVKEAETMVKETGTYLIAEPHDTKNTLQIEYWITQGEIANNIRSHTSFKVLNNAEIMPDTVVLLNNTFGGKKQLQAGERLHAYRYALTSRDRLFTQEDIKNFCKYELGTKLKEVNFSKGLAASHHPKQGFIRTLDIILVPFKYQELSIAEWNHIAQDLLCKIKANTAGEINYRVIVHSK